MSPQEFLAWEATQEERYEYVNSRIVAMTGGTIPHNDLTLNLYRALYDHTHGVPYAGIAHVLGQSAMYWYQATQALGRISITLRHLF
jgi:Uma2 family endonuclease